MDEHAFEEAQDGHTGYPANYDSTISSESDSGMKSPIKSSYAALGR